MAERSEEERTEELRLDQLKRETEELDKLAGSELPDEKKQHERRAEKSAYLREKLEERARAEREARE